MTNRHNRLCTPYIVYPVHFFFKFIRLNSFINYHIKLWSFVKRARLEDTAQNMNDPPAEPATPSITNIKFKYLFDEFF